MKIGKYEIKNKNIIRLSNILDEIYDTCADIYNEKENYSYDELCATQMLLDDISFSVIHRLRSNNYEIYLPSGGIDAWKNDEDIFDILKKQTVRTK